MKSVTCFCVTFQTSGRYNMAFLNSGSKNGGDLQETDNVNRGLNIQFSGRPERGFDIALYEAAPSESRMKNDDLIMGIMWYL